jgi:D-glycero-beta-D-manno-heptose 1-phosphate adenylyltransferase
VTPRGSEGADAFRGRRFAGQAGCEENEAPDAGGIVTQASFRSAASKIASLEEVASYVAAARAQGRTVALANGCFDVLHVGHVRYLEAASAEADVLVVGVNGDESVRRLKGPKRPVLAEADRALLVAALRAVARVVIFHESDVTHLIRTFKPDVHCKGTDYTEANVPEREVVRACGGRVAIVGDPKEHDTRQLFKRVRG